MKNNTIVAGKSFGRCTFEKSHRHENNSNITLLSRTSVACDVVIVNESLEEMSTYPCVISEVPTTIPLDSTGEYHISITLVNGTCYYGVFLIEIMR